MPESELDRRSRRRSSPIAKRKSSRTGDLKVIRRGLRLATWLRYVNGGLIVGGGGLVVGMLVGGAPLSAPSVFGLTVAFAILLAAQTLLAQALMPRRRFNRRLRIPSFLIMVSTLGIAGVALRGGKPNFPMEPYGTDWWSMAVAGLLVTIDGSSGRMATDQLIDELSQIESRIVKARTPSRDYRRPWKKLNG